MGVFSELKPKNSARKNPFDLSAYVTFNQKCGMIVPLKFWPTLPNSEYSLDLKALLRTQPLSTAAFAGFSINYDVVWTPYNDHYSSFNQFIAQRLNKQHTTQPDIQAIPSFNLGAFVRLLISIGIYDSFCADYGYQNYRRFMNDTPSVNVPWFFLYSENMPEESMALSCLRTLDMLEYGNYLGYLKMCKNAIMDYLDGMTYTVPDNKNLPYFVRYLALVEKSVAAGGALLTTMPSLSNFSFTGSVGLFLEHELTYVFEADANKHPLLPYSYDINILNDIDDNQYVDLWSVMCYNKAFWQFYRNEYYDIDFKYFYWNSSSYAFSILEYVFLFNFDDFTTPLSPAMDELDADGLRLLAMFAVKPHQYKKDLFTGLLPSTQYGSVSFATSTSSDWFKLLGDISSSGVGYLPDGQLFVDGNEGDKVAMSNGSSYTISASKFKTDPAIMISMLELRRADSLQRFRERMLRAGNKTKDIFQAHGWEHPLSEKAFEAQFFGSFDGRLDLNVVASTGEFGSGEEKINLGQLAANGVGAIGGNTVRFKSHDFGTLLVVAYITKDAIYDAYGINKAHTLLEAFDFPYPELQNVSLAPIVQKQLNCIGLNNSSLNSVLGYLPQNMAYKTATDLVHGEFFSALPLQPNGQERVAYPQGIFANMVTPRQDINIAKQLSFFYIQPSCVDNVFVINSNGNQDTDQFFTNVRIDLKCVQPLDVIGLPI